MARKVASFGRVILVSVGCVVAAVGVGSAAGPKESFADVLKTHFDNWIKDSPNKKLTAERVNALVNSPRIKGDEAAAIAALHLYFRGQKTPEPVGEGALLGIPNASDQEEERRDQLKKPVNLEKSFSQFRTHLANSSRTLFENGAPKRLGISQGRLGDCFVVAPLGTMATHHSARLKGMIEPQSEGGWVVTFPGEKPIKVPRLTDTQIVLGSSAKDQGLWLNVMEEAIAIDNRMHGINKTASVAMDVISSGGSASRSIQLLTGHAGATIRLQPASAKDKEAAQAEALKILVAVHKDKILATANTSASEGLPKGIVTKHVYGVIDFDPKTEHVTMWNPWGNKFEPKGEPGLTNGYHTEHGIFVIPLPEFFKVFAGLEHQTTKPLPNK